MAKEQYLQRNPQSNMADKGGRGMSATRTITLMWMAIGLGPLFLQIKGYAQFVTPHKISENLITPANGDKQTSNLHKICPVNELFMAGAFWNVNPTHYFHVRDGILCHYVMPQYNLHGNYFLGNYTVEPYRTTPSSCAKRSFPFANYFYHGSISYYSFYAEGEGTYCALDDIAYDIVKGVGSRDINGASLANDKGRTGYLRSFWYAFAGSALVLIRCWVLRRSYVACKRYARRFDHMSESIRFQNAVVFVQESMRLSAHGVRSYHRIVLLFLLLDQGLMSDLFLLITQEGFVGRVQCISLGYNLAGIMSMLFEIVESMNWMGHRTHFLIKRLLFNYETALVGELITAAVMQFYLTTLNRSSLRNTESEAKAVSYYVMSLVGHGVIALGCVFVIVCTRSFGAISYVLWNFRTLSVFLKPCSVDATLGVRMKLVLLGGYVLENGELYYKIASLKAYGLFRMIDEEENEFIVYGKLNWISILRDYLHVCGVVLGARVGPCNERHCSGVVSMFDQALGGEFVDPSCMTLPECIARSVRPHVQLLSAGPAIHADNVAYRSVTTRPYLLSQHHLVPQSSPLDILGYLHCLFN